MIEVNATISIPQTIKKFDIVQANIQKERAPDGSINWTARIVAMAEYENGSVGPIVREYLPEEFDAFWKDFKNGAFLFTEMTEKLGIKVAIPKTIEDTFKYVSPEDQLKGKEETKE